jgi:hypothetical protein
MCVDDGEPFVFESPRRLNLQLFCTPQTPTKDNLDVWPALPLIVRGHMFPSGTDNIIAALGQSNRVCRVNLGLVGWHSEEVLAAMQEPYPELTDLRLWSDRETPLVIPDSFLGGSAPRLQFFRFRDCQICFCQLLTLSTFGFLIPGTFHPKRSSLCVVQP